MLCLVSLAALGEDFRNVEYAVWVGAGTDSLGRKGLDICHATVLKGDCLIKRVEFVVFVTDYRRVGKVDSEDADTTGSYV